MSLKSLSVLSLVPASLVTLLIVAASSPANPTTESINIPSSALINLNQMSASLTQENQSNNPILHSLDCSCSICAGVATPNLI